MCQTRFTQLEESLNNRLEVPQSEGSSSIGPMLGFLGDKSANAQFEQEGWATFIVLFYRPLPDSWRNFKTTTCPPFHTTSLSIRPALCPLTRSKAGQGFNCKFKPVFTAATWKNRHLQCSRRLPPPFDLPLTSSCSSSVHRQFCCHSARPRCHFTAHSLSSLAVNCVCVRAQ